MAGQILQINFKFDVSGAELAESLAPLADPIAAVSGLRWKVWIMNEAEKEAGGIYLFEDFTAVTRGPVKEMLQV